MTARLFSLNAFRAARSIGSKSPLQSAEKIEARVQENRSAAGERVEIRSDHDSFGVRIPVRQAEDVSR